MAEAIAISSPLVRVVDGNDSDHAFVYATWLQSFRSLSDFAKPIPKDIYFPHQHDRIERLLKRAKLEVAIPAGESDRLHTILGYAVTDGALLHWLYVKGNWRRMGIGSELLRGKELREFTHWTYDFDHIATKQPQLKYNPY